MPEPRRNLSSFLDDLERRGDGPAFALRTPYRRFTWSGAQVRRAALGLAGRLREGGLVPGDRVLLSGPSCPEWAAALLGIVAAGGIAVPLDEVSPPEFGRRVGAKVAARAAILPAARARELAGVAPRTETLESLRLLAAVSGPLRAPHQAAPGDTAEIVFTSGTTAEPKGVELSHGNLLASLEGIEAGFRARQWYLRPLLPLRLLCLVPLSHLFGQSVGIFVPIALRSVGIYSSTLQPARLLGEIRREGPIVVIAVPRTLAGLADAARRELGRRGRAERFEKGFERARGRGLARRILATRDIRRILGWRTLAFVSGGAALDREIEEFWTRCGIFVIQGYGMTEAAPIIAVHNPLDGVAGTIGHAAGAQEIRLAEDGEILVRGPNIMKGYYGDPAATGEVLREGWLHTGDLGELDAGGRLFFRGRKKDVIVTADGMNIHPSDVEEVLCAVPGVGGAVVFALPGPAGEEIHAAVLAAGSPPDPEAVRQAANGRLLGHQKLRGVIVWGDSDFPRTRIGKVKRGEVAAVALALRAGAGRRAARGSEAQPWPPPAPAGPWPPRSRACAGRVRRPARRSRPARASPRISG